jgi:hypothetical protein
MASFEAKGRRFVSVGATSYIYRTSVLPTLALGLSLTGDGRCPGAGPLFRLGSPGNKKSAVSSGFLEADEGTRTLDLLHGKQTL